MNLFAILMFALLVLVVTASHRHDKIRRPACDKLGNYYDSKHELRIAARHDRNIKYDPKRACLKRKLPTKPCPEFCITLYKPVCDKKGRKYGNSCELGIAACHDKTVVYDPTGACLRAKLK